MPGAGVCLGLRGEGTRQRLSSLLAGFGMDWGGSGFVGFFYGDFLREVAGPRSWVLSAWERGTPASHPRPPESPASHPRHPESPTSHPRPPESPPFHARPPPPKGFGLPPPRCPGRAEPSPRRPRALEVPMAWQRLQAEELRPLGQPGAGESGWKRRPGHPGRGAGRGALGRCLSSPAWPGEGWGWVRAKPFGGSWPAPASPWRVQRPPNSSHC